MAEEPAPHPAAGMGSEAGAEGREEADEETAAFLGAGEASSGWGGAADLEPEAAAFSRRAAVGLAVAIYGPTIVVFVARSICVPVLPLFARQTLGASDSLVGLSASGQGLGSIFASAGSGLFIGHCGYEVGLNTGVAAMMVASCLAGLAQHVGLLVLGQVLYGCGWSTFTVSLQTRLRQAIPGSWRGRAMSFMGGSYRVGYLTGPLIGAATAKRLNSLRAVFFLQAAMLVCLLAVTTAQALVGWQRRKRGYGAAAAGAGGGEGKAEKMPYAEMLRLTGKDLATAGVACMVIQFFRASRDLVLPLRGDDLNLGVVEVGLVVACSAGADLLFFPVSGVLMDKFGRKSAMVPSFLVFALSMATTSFAGTKLTLAFGGVLFGISNGLVSGVVMCIGADLAPEGRIGDFVGLWRLITDSGMFTGPVALGGLSSAFSLPVAMRMYAGFGLASAVFAIFLVRETKPRHQYDPVRHDSLKHNMSLRSIALGAVPRSPPAAVPAA